MATVLDIITRAFRKLGISGEGEVLSAEAAAEGLDALNDMLEGWNLQGINRTHRTLALAEEMPLAPKFNEGVTYLLASRLGPNYQVPPSFRPEPFMAQVRAAFLVIDEVDMPSALTRLPSSRPSGWGPDY